MCCVVFVSCLFASLFGVFFGVCMYVFCCCCYWLCAWCFVLACVVFVSCSFACLFGVFLVVVCMRVVLLFACVFASCCVFCVVVN